MARRSLNLSRVVELGVRRVVYLHVARLKIYPSSSGCVDCHVVGRIVISVVLAVKDRAKLLHHLRIVLFMVGIFHKCNIDPGIWSCNSKK